VAATARVDKRAGRAGPAGSKADPVDWVCRSGRTSTGRRPRSRWFNDSADSDPNPAAVGKSNQERVDLKTAVGVVAKRKFGL